MAFVVCEPCIKCRYTDCVDVCPVACFRVGATMVVIDPDECIDCGVCVDECPTGAIFPEDEVPEEWHEFIALNATYAKQWPVIERTRGPLPTADAYRDIEEKRGLFDDAPGEPDPPL